MISYPPAKINIGLNIIRKRLDGYHDIESVFYPIPVVDILEINKAEQFSFSMSGLKIDGDNSNNLVVKAFNLLKEIHSISDVRIHLHKQIPMGAGLGGGSADAAYSLVMLNSLFELNLSSKTLEEYALILGSDCPFFVDGSPKYITGTGSIMKEQKIDLTNHYLWLINPNTHISTKEAYAEVIPKRSENNIQIDIASDPSKWKGLIKNDFESSVFEIHPVLSEIKTKMYENGALYASMSGSGSTMYAICKNEPLHLGGYEFERTMLL